MNDNVAKKPNNADSVETGKKISDETRKYQKYENKAKETLGLKRAHM